MPSKNKSKRSRKLAFNESSWHVTNFLRDLDNFGRQIPAFNIKGKDSVNTVVGGFLSFAIMTVTLGYAIGGIVDLINREDPIINENIVQDYYGLTDLDGLNLKESNQKMAIAVLNENEQDFYNPR